MALVILDGIDGVGKSTLAKLLRDNYGYRWVKRAASDVHPLVDYTAELEERAQRARAHDYTANVVCDRWHYSEWVYSRARRDGDPRLSDTMFEAIDQYLIQRGAVAVHCYGDPDRVREVLELRGESDKHPQEQLDREAALFGAAFSRTIVPVLYVELGSAFSSYDDVHRAAKNWEAWACS